MKKLDHKSSMIIGSLLFGMLFGAGNVIFPILMGQRAAQHYWPASLGFLITAVGMPIIAILSFALSKKESLFEYAAVAGKPFGYLFTLLLLLTIGPLFATPRTATVAFAVGFAPFIKGSQTMPLLLYSTLFFSLVMYFAFRPSNLINTIGKFMAPLFFVLISIMMCANFIKPMGSPADFQAIGNYVHAPLTQGIIDGYFTMDVLACLAFGIIIIENLNRFGITEANAIAKETLRSSLTTILLMSLLYIAFTYFGATSLGIMTPQANGGIILGLGSAHLFGQWGHALLAFTITLACLKTAIGLAVSVSATLNKLFPNLFSEKIWTILFVLVSYFIANFGLDTIISYSLPVLMFLYPLAITLILLWLIHALWPLKKSAFTLSIMVAMVPAFFDFLNAAPDFIKNQSLINFIITWPKNILPLYKEGFGWLVPVLVTLVFCIIMLKEER